MTHSFIMCLPVGTEKTMAQDLDESQQPLIPTQLTYDPSYGGINEMPRAQADAVSVNANPSDALDIFVTAGEKVPPSVIPPELQDGKDTTTPGARPADQPLDSPLHFEEEEEEEEMVCKRCTSWYDWCLFLSCKLTVLVSPLRMPLRERKCLRRARTEGWRLLWSLVLPLAVGSVPLQLVWLLTQLHTSLALLGWSVVECAANGCNGWNAACVFASGLWMLFTLVDAIVCLVAIRFYRNDFVWKISSYITVLRMMYTAICLHIVVIGFNFSAGFVFHPGNDTGSYYRPTCSISWPIVNVPLSQAKFGFSFASLCVFVNLTLLIVAVQFTRKSLKIRNAIPEAYGQPSKRAERLFLFYIVSELIVHFLLVLSSIYFAFNLVILSSSHEDVGRGGCMTEDDNLTSVACCQYTTEWYSITAVVFAVLSFVIPFCGLLSIYFIDYFWLQIYLASVYLSVQSILQDRETVARLGIPVNVCERLQERTQDIDSELLKRSVKNFRGDMTFRRKVAFLCENPLSVVYSQFLVGFLFLMLMVMFYPYQIFYHFLFFSVTSLIAAPMIILIHFRVIVVGVIFLPVTLTVILASPAVCACVLPVAVLLWLRYRHSPRSCTNTHRSCTNTHRCCHTDPVP